MPVVKCVKMLFKLNYPSPSLNPLKKIVISNV